MLAYLPPSYLSREAFAPFEIDLRHDTHCSLAVRITTNDPSSWGHIMSVRSVGVSDMMKLIRSGSLESIFIALVGGVLLVLPFG